MTSTRRARRRWNSHELFRAAGDLDTVYVPIGMGSGIVGTITARDMLGLKTKIVGVVAEGADAIALSFAAGRPVSTNTASTFADGMAVRVVNPEAFAHIHKGVDRIVTVSDDEIAEAVRLYFRCCHTVAEGAGAAPLAALMQEREAMKGKRAGVILSGGNIDMPKFAEALEGRTPAA
jgi:threonine dehydratase